MTYLEQTVRVVKDWRAVWWVERRVGEIAANVNQHMPKSAAGIDLVATSRQPLRMLGGHRSVPFQVHRPLEWRRAFEGDPARDFVGVRTERKTADNQ